MPTLGEVSYALTGLTQATFSLTYQLQLMHKMSANPRKDC